MPVKHRLKYFAIRSVIAGLGKFSAVIPEKLTYNTCVKLLLYLKDKFPKFRELARTHLNIAFGDEKTPEEIDAILHQTYINYGMNLAEFLMLTHKSAEWIERKVDFDDPNWEIRTEHEKGRGVVTLGGHFGSWELVGARIALHRYPIVIVAKAQRDAIFSRFIMDTRTKWGNEYIFRERGVKEECHNQLDRGKILALLADQNSSRGVYVDFFGKKAMTATGPAEIAMKRGLPVIPGFPARNPDGTITLHIKEPLQMRDTGDFEADLLFNTQMCNRAVEDFARVYPAEYFWWHRRWKSKPKKTTEEQ